MAKVKTFEVASDVKVYFADPHSPWQRGTNERFNRDIREYFPKGTNFTHVTDQEVEQAQNELNDRAREASWVLFRFLYGGQFPGPGLIVSDDGLGGGGIVERLVEASVVPPVDPVQCRPFDLGA